ncbi:MAG: hypothetical protein ACOCQG_05725 [Candidatus Nanoarchaeia archaeon]
MEKSGSEKTYPSRRRACYQSVTGSGRFLIDYNTKNESWDTAGELPREREHHTIEHFNDKIYLISGRWDGENIASIDVYYPQNGSFETIKIKKGVSGHGSAILENKLHIIGGEHLRNLLAYDLHQVVFLENNKTYKATSLPTKRHGHRAYSTNNSIITLGGAIGPEYDTFKTTTAMDHKWKAKTS